MDILIVIVQLIVGLGILNVWLLRFNVPSDYRGGDAQNMIEEFQAYGLPNRSVYVVGFLKVMFAVLILVGILVPSLAQLGAVGLGVLMASAIIMHFKIGDPPKKSLPAFILLVLCILIVAVL